MDIDITDEQNWLGEIRKSKEDIDANRFQFDGEG